MLTINLINIWTQINATGNKLQFLTLKADYAFCRHFKAIFPDWTMILVWDIVCENYSFPVKI